MGGCLIIFGLSFLYILKGYVFLPLTLFTLDEEGIYPHGALKQYRRKIRWEEVERMELVKGTFSKNTLFYIAIWLHSSDSFVGHRRGGWVDFLTRGAMSDGYTANLYIGPTVCGLKEDRLLEILTTLWRRKVPAT
jgi:hypothetical protein